MQWCRLGCLHGYMHPKEETDTPKAPYNGEITPSPSQASVVQLLPVELVCFTVINALELMHCN